jgi:putative DNA primase/helicase
MQAGTTDMYAEYGENAVTTRSTKIDPFFQSAGVTELFHTPDQLAYATILNSGHAEHWSLASRTFRFWLKNHLFQLSGSFPSEGMVRQLVSTMEGHALFDGAEHRVFVRIGETDGA